MYIVRYTTYNISWSIASPTAFSYTPQTITTTPTCNTLPLTSFIPHNGQAKTIALCLLPPTFATATPFGQKPCATTCISNSTHEEPKLHTRRTQTPHTKNPSSTHEETVRALQDQPFSQANICSKIRTQEPHTEAKRSNAKGPRSLIIKQPGPFL